MSDFRPTRASSPSKHGILGGRGQTSASDISRSSAVSSSELQGLTPQDIEFLDAVIQRASPSASTFLTVFKAYNDVLNERGLDPQNEVVYYGKLLKLGTLRGSSWGDKWRMVKLQQGHSGDFASSVESGHHPAPRGLPPISTTRVSTRFTTSSQDDDLFTLHSHQDDSENVETEAETETEVDKYQYHPTPRSILRLPSSEPASTANSISGLNGNPRSGPIAPTASRRPMLLPPIQSFHPWDNASDVTEEVRTPSTTPPSYGAAVGDTHVYRNAHYVPGPRFQVMRPLSAPAIPKANPIKPGEQRKSVINEDDAWTKVKMLQDKKLADQFCGDKLVERSWAVWKSGFDWIIVRFNASSVNLCYNYFSAFRRPMNKYLRPAIYFSFAPASNVGETRQHPS
jgi:protein SFI1